MSDVLAGPGGGVLERMRAICGELPETEEAQGWQGVTFKVRRRTFAHVFSVEDPAGASHDMVVFRADPEEREFLVRGGHPFFAPRRATNEVGLVLTRETDWVEVRELLTESYRVVAPKKLAELV